MPTFAPVDEQLTYLKKGAAEIIREGDLRAKLEKSRASGKPLRVKLGMDPTAPDLHLGHTVVLRKLRDFQDLGHQIIVIIGDFTGLIGDPTGRSETRRPLTRDEILANAETYRAQLGKVIDMPSTRVEFNSTWLGPLTFESIIREAASLTVARMLQREDFAARYAAERPISLHEFLYPIAQAYDSVALNADVEMGGTDQTFNLLVGRDLQRAHGQEPQIALTVPLLEGLDGVQKMSKSYGNYVGINEKPEDIFGKLMSVSDAMMWRYFELLTRIPESEIAVLRSGHPMEAKKRLARTITAQYHGERGAVDAKEYTGVFTGAYAINPFTKADSLVPRMSSRLKTAMMNSAGTFIMPWATTVPAASCSFSNGEWHQAYGICRPTNSSSLFRYSLHAIATVAAPTAYSSTKSQPMIQATNSPIVTYEYV